MCSSNQFFISDYKDVDKIPDNKPFKPLTFVTEVKWNDGRRVPFRWDGEYTYRLRKTYFAGRSPYAFIRLLV